MSNFVKIDVEPVAFYNTSNILDSDLITLEKTSDKFNFIDLSYVEIEYLAKTFTSFVEDHKATYNESLELSKDFEIAEMKYAYLREVINFLNTLEIKHTHIGELISVKHKEKLLRLGYLERDLIALLNDDEGAMYINLSNLDKNIKYNQARKEFCLIKQVTCSTR